MQTQYSCITKCLSTFVNRCGLTCYNLKDCLLDSQLLTWTTDWRSSVNFQTVSSDSLDTSVFTEIYYVWHFCNERIGKTKNVSWIYTWETEPKQNETRLLIRSQNLKNIFSPLVFPKSKTKECVAQFLLIVIIRLCNVVQIRKIEIENSIRKVK